MMIEIWAGIALLVVIAVHFGFRHMLKRLAQMDEGRRKEMQQKSARPETDGS